MKNIKYSATMQWLAEKGVQTYPLPEFKSIEDFYAEIDLVNQGLMQAVNDRYEHCPECNGIGIVNRNGHLMNCPAHCIASQYNKYDYLMRMTDNMKSTTDQLDFAQKMDFKRYATGANNTDRSIALQVAEEFVKSYPHGIEYQGTMKNSLMFYGEPGTGKTALSSAIVKESLKRGHMAWFSRVDDIMAAIRSTFSRNGEESKFTTEQMIRFFAKVDILAMDEFDMSKISDYDLQQIERIINHRADAHLPTLMTTNLTQEQFKTRWGYRTHSRVVHMAHWVSINGVIRNQNKPIGEL